MRALSVCLLSSLLAAFAVGCAGVSSEGVQPTPSTATYLPPTFAAKEFALPASTPNPACIPPCFYRVVPGRTTATETLSILGATLTQIDTPVDGSLWWRTEAPPREWYAVGQLVYNDINFRDGVVHSIVLQPGQHEMTLGDVVDLYGEPDLVAIGFPEGKLLIDLFLLYPLRGMAFVTTLESASEDKAGLLAAKPEMLVDKTIYFAPTTKINLTPAVVSRWRASGRIAGVYEWLGFGNSIR